MTPPTDPATPTTGRRAGKPARLAARRRAFKDGRLTAQWRAFKDGRLATRWRGFKNGRSATQWRAFKDGRLATRWRVFWRLLREFTGDRAYEQYLEHRAAAHPGEPVLAEREFWRLRTDSRSPSGCC